MGGVTLNKSVFFVANYYSNTRRLEKPQLRYVYTVKNLDLSGDVLCVVSTTLVCEFPQS